MWRVLTWLAEASVAAVFFVEVVWPLLRRRPLFPTYRKLRKANK